jgi:hypothetical protein
MSPLQLRSLKKLYRIAVSIYQAKQHKSTLFGHNIHDASTQKMIFLIRQMMLEYEYFKNMVNKSPARLMITAR